MEHTSLKRSLNLFDATAIGLGAIVGAGIFVVIGVAAGITGPSLLLAIIIAGIAATLNGLSSAQLAAAFPQSGGTYEYGYHIIHPYAGFSAGWMFLLSKLTAGGVVAIGFGSYIQLLFPALSYVLIGGVAVVFLTFANLIGIRKTGYLNIFIISITLGCLLYFVFSGLPNVSTDNFTPFATGGWLGIAEASALMFFAFTGYARIATLAEEVKSPEKTIPRAVIITIVSAIVLYLLVAVVAIGVAGTDYMAESTSPLLAISLLMETPGIRIVMITGASTAMLGVLLSQILGISRMMLAMSRRNDLPKALNRISNRSSIPHIAVILTGAIILGFTIFGSFTLILSTAAFTILLYYAIANWAAFSQKSGAIMYHKAVPAIGLVFCILMAFSLSLNTILSGLALLFVGVLFKFINDYLNKS